MQAIKEANKFNFGLGIFLFATFSFHILLTGFDIKSTLGFLLGIYNIWQHGFVNDASRWKVKPKLILVVSIGLLFSVFGVLQIIRINNIDNKDQIGKKIIEAIIMRSKEELPKAIGENGDSCIKISAINEYTLEYIYKVNSKISELDSSTLKSFKLDARIILMDNLNKSGPEILNEFRKNKIAFRHKYADVDGNIISVIELNESDY